MRVQSKEASLFYFPRYDTVVEVASFHVELVAVLQSIFRVRVNGDKRRMALVAEVGDNHTVDGLRHWFSWFALFSDCDPRAANFSFISSQKVL